MNAARIVQVAQSYLGQREKDGNRGWLDPVFEAKMKAVGWKVTDSWCCYFTELVAKEAFAENAEMVKAFDTLFSPNCQATYANFSGSKLFKVSKVPKPGALVIWRLGKGWKGHIGVIESIKDGFMTTIEGNTNAAGGREGVEVARKRRKLAWTYGSGLNLVGFIYLV